MINMPLNISSENSSKKITLISNCCSIYSLQNIQEIKRTAMQIFFKQQHNNDQFREYVSKKQLIYLTAMFNPVL